MDTEAPIFPFLAKPIWVLDDDPSMMLICAKTLRAEGFTVLEAAGSSEALKILTTHQVPIDLLLTDLMLPRHGPSIDLHQKSISASPWSGCRSTDSGNEEDIPRDLNVEPVVP